MGDLIAVLLAPYNDVKTAGDRVHMSMPEVPVGERAVTTLALVVHELATNSIKYGALSEATGRVDIVCTLQDDDVVLVWSERGCPPVVTPPPPPGFGTKLIAPSIANQLGGSFAIKWREKGIVVTLQMSQARLAA